MYSNLNLAIFKKNFILKIYLFLIATFPITILSGNLLINTSIFLIDLLFIFQLFKENKLGFLKNNFFYFLIFFWFSLLINLYFSDNFNSSLERSIGFVRFIIFIFALQFILNYKNSEYKNLILYSWTIIFFTVSFDLIYEFINEKNILGFVSPMGGRLSSFLNQELKIGHFYMGFGGIILVFLYEKFNKKILIYTLLVITFLILSLLIGERSNFIKFLLIIFLFSSLLLYCHNWKYITVIVSAIITLIIFFTILDFKFLSTKVTDNMSVTGRYISDLLMPIQKKGLVKYIKDSPYGAHYYIAFEIYKKNKFTGIGLKNFRFESGKKKYFNENIKHSTKLWSTHPHQVHFEFLAETGLFGYLCFLIFFLLSFIFFFKKNLNKFNNFNVIGFLFIFVNILPLLPSGSFFTTYGASIFWLNYSFMISEKIKD